MYRTYKKHADYEHRKNSSYHRGISDLWYETSMGQEFIDIVGLSQNSDGTWVLSDEKYRYMGVTIGDRSLLHGLVFLMNSQQNSVPITS